MVFETLKCPLTLFHQNTAPFLFRALRGSVIVENLGIGSLVMQRFYLCQISTIYICTNYMTQES